jgi:Domain of unknown function (DUF4259)
VAATWGAGLFQDDLATDFATQIIEGNSLDVVHHALTGAGQVRGHLLYELAVRALIAGEVLAALGGKPAKAMPPELQDWVAAHCGEAIADALWPLARSAVERVKEDSEISELWARSDQFALWIEKVDDLLGRLDQSASASPATGSR